MTKPNYPTASHVLLRGLLLSATITLGFLTYAHMTGQHEHKQDIAVMGLIICFLHLGRYLFFIEPTLERPDEEE